MNTTQKVVVEDRRSRRGLVWIAAALGAVLLGGSTFAYWSSNALFTGGTITAGDLNLVQTTDTEFFDVSVDRTDATATLPGTDGSQKGHLIDDISTWLMVPGDKVAAAMASTVTLTGDNLVAKLSIAGLSTTSTNSSLTWSYEVYKNDTLLVTETALPSNGALMYLSATPDGQDYGLEDANGTTVKAMTLDSETFTIVIYATFADTAGDAGQANKDTTTGVYTDQTEDATGTRQDANSAAALNDILLQLDQVRDTGVIFKPVTPP